jgi:hypothetical protein
MTRSLPPPRTEPIVDDDKFATLNWLAFLEGLADGDLGTTWTPTFVGLTETGVATKAGRYWRITKNLAFFRITITPATDTSATLGTTYCDNFPLNITANGFVATVSGFTSSTSGATTDKRIYTGTWTSITTPINIIGIVEVS